LVEYVRFWNDALGKYDITRSTGILIEGKRERRRDAEEAAETILAELRQQRAVAEPSVAVKQVVSAIQVPEAAKPQSNTDQFFVQYILDFWTPESKGSIP
jgi:hypothetical protein